MASTKTYLAFGHYMINYIDKHVGHSLISKLPLSKTLTSKIILIKEKLCCHFFNSLKEVSLSYFYVNLFIGSHLTVQKNIHYYWYYIT